MEDTLRYSTMDLDDLESFYWDEIAPAMRADGLAPETERPRYRWLNGRYPGFVKRLQRGFEFSPGDFYDDRGIPPESTDAEPFDFVDHDGTRRALVTYLDELGDPHRRGRAQATVDTRRSILRRYVAVYQDVHESDDLLSRLLDRSHRPDEIERVVTTFDVLGRTLGTLASRRKYVEDVRQFYTHLVDAGRAVYNPLVRLERRFGWDESPDWDNPALGPDEVRALYRAADDPVDRFLVVGLCGWGLRPSEVCSLHASQLRLDPADDDVPYVEFGAGERKNGPGTVALIAGLDVLLDRLETVQGPDGDWDGYFLPSSRSSSGHLSTETARRRFSELAADAGVTVGGDTPTPKMGRRFWYTTYGDAVRRVAERFQDVAGEQGSTSASVVLENYLSETERRKHRREEMRDELEGLFA